MDASLKTIQATKRRLVRFDVFECMLIDVVKYLVSAVQIEETVYFFIEKMVS